MDKSKDQTKNGETLHGLVGLQGKYHDHCISQAILTWLVQNEEISQNTKREIEFTHYYYPHKAKDGQLNFYSCKLNRAPLKKTSCQSSGSDKCGQ